MTDVVTVEDLYTRPSPSALQLVDLCQARAAARYVAREPDNADNQKANLGSRCHAITADYASKGTVPPNHETFEIVKNGTPRTYYPGRVVRNILHRLPFAAGTVPHVEHKLTLKWRGIEFNGSIDWETERLQGDHKFTTDLSYGFDNSGYNKDGKSLKLDAQRIIYSADWFMRHDDDELTQQWTYGQFDYKASRAVKLVATRAEIFKLLDDVIMPNADKLLGWVQNQVDWNTLPKNANACSKFPPTGCPYSSKCTRTQRERIHGLMSSSFIERLKAKDAAKAGASTPPTPPPAAPLKVIPNDAPSTDVETDAEDAVAAIAGTVSAPPSQGGPIPDGSPAGRAQYAKQLADAATYQRGGVSPINPPGEAADLPESATVAEKTAASAEPKKRGRPKKDATSTMIKPISAAADAITSELVGATAADTAPELRGFYLLIDCLPVRGALGNDMIHAADLIAQAHEHVRKECEVLDFRLVEYGKGAGMLAATMEVIVSELPDGSVVYLDTKSAEGSVVLQTLMSKASAVIRAA